MSDLDPKRDAGDDGTGEAQKFVDLPSGEALTLDQAAEIARDAVTRLVIVAGPTGSGKTTILTALYEAFLEAPFANFLFRGSRTLVGFERRCHLGREESGQLAPDTSHTSVREGVLLLHLDLALKDEAISEHKHILISDISGEIFKNLRDSSHAVAEMSLLKRTDNLCLVLDGEKIASTEQRHVARNDGRSILRSIIEADVLSNNAIIDVTFTKWDLVVEAFSRDPIVSIKSYINDTKSALRAIAPGHEVRFHEVAARPTSGMVHFAHGLPTLLRSWFDGGQTGVSHAPVRSATSTRLREFGRFTGAVLASERDSHV